MEPFFSKVAGKEKGKKWLHLRCKSVGGCDEA